MPSGSLALRTLGVALVLIAATSCNTPSPTAVSESAAADVLIGRGYQRANLPFRPVAINDSGVIVGNQNNKGVRFFNGTLTVLRPPAGSRTAYAAVDITRNGHVLGVSNGRILIWTNPLVAPQVVTSGLSVLEPSSMNEDHMVVGTLGGFGFRWTPAGGFQTLANPFGFAGGRANHVSRNGYVAGFASPVFGGEEGLIRWDPNGTSSVLLPVGNSSPPENRPSDIDDFGNILSTSGGTTINWTVGGSVITISGAPQPTRTGGWSPLGRIIGHTIGPSNKPWMLFQGTLTWLPQPSPADAADIPVGVNACGTIVARRVNGGVVLDSGYVWSRALACDIGGVIEP